VRLTTLLVEQFQALIRAEVAFGPGLNVIYGPNDLGKSTLAQAIRAALLVVPTSSASAPFQPWYADAVPRVALSFEDDDGQHWRVRKTFETSAQSGSAELFHSKDGMTFALDVKGRQVEERLRAILGWGIAAPGGKGGSRGLPESFLTHSLLAAQTDIDHILGESLAEDATDTGKVRLSKALATLAQDPLFKKVLDAVQHEVDACFTPKGQHKQGQASRFFEARRLLKDYESQLKAARKLEEEATAGAAVVASLRAQQMEQIVAVGEAQAAVKVVRSRLQRWREREEAADRLRLAREGLAHIDARASEVAVATAEVDRLSEALRSAEEAFRRSTAECETAKMALSAGEEAHRLATSEDSTRERDLRLAKARAEHAENSSKIQAAETRRAKVEEVIVSAKAADEAKHDVVKARDALERAARDEAIASEQVVELEKALDLARKLIEYGRCKAAAHEVQEATQAAANASQSRGEAETKERGADGVAQTAQPLETGVSIAAAKLPTPERVKVLLQLEREVERVEAALGGGLSIVLRPRGPVALKAVIDHSTALDERALEGKRVLEAERMVQLTVGNLDVEITAGAAEKRRGLAELRARWTSEAVPVLEAAGCPSLADVEESLSRVSADRQRLELLRREADTLRTEAKELRARASLFERQAVKLADATRDLKARETALAGCDLGLLEGRFAKLGTAWEARAEELLAQAEKALAEALIRAGTSKNESGIAAYKVSQAKERAASAAQEAVALAGTLEDPEGLLRSLAQSIAMLSERQGELTAAMAALAVEGTGEVQRAAQAVETARARVATAKSYETLAAQQRDQLLADRSTRAGHRDTIKTQLDAMDRSLAVQTVEQCEHRLALFALDVATTDADIQGAESILDRAKRSLDEIRSGLHHAEGALSNVGGMAVAEEVARLEEAVKSAQARWQDLEADADAYKLLRDTLRGVENAEGTHLGRALSRPVAARFRDLTEGRYGALHITPALKTEGVSVPGASADNVLAELSVGTREQLATLIRLAIAEHLKSTIILDDQLVQTDPKRLAWFRDVLRRTSVQTQVIVLTCRPGDYLQSDELPNETAIRDLAGGTVRAIDFTRVAKRWTPSPSQAPARTSERPSAPVAPSTSQRGPS
jgi:DNA repair exonuclease SbcCD ATPase subunit